VVFIPSGAGVVATSQITGLRYLKRNGTSYTHPFGGSSATDKEIDAFNAIAAAVNNPGARFSSKPERQYRN